METSSKISKNPLSGLGLECDLGNELMQLHVFGCKTVICGAIIDLSMCNCMRLFICVFLKRKYVST